MEILGKLFGSPARVRILRLFIFNPHEVFDRKTVIERTRAQAATVSRELALLHKIGLIQPRVGYYLGKNNIKKKVPGWMLNNTFKYLIPLQNFLMHAGPIRDKDLLNEFKSVGTIKLLLVSGVFIRDLDSRVDLLVVGDNIKEKALTTTVRRLEADLGRELRFASFSTDDFKYRMGVYDKLVRDIFDYPYHVLVDRLEVTTGQKRK